MKKASRGDNLKNKNSREKKPGNIFLLCLLVILLFVLETLFLDKVTKAEGIKIGLYNSLIVFLIMQNKPKTGYLLAGVKIIAGMFITSNILFYSLIGSVLSVTAMIGIKKMFKDKIGYLGVSVTGALTYNITVYLIAALSLSSAAVFYNLPSVLLLSVIYGGLTGSLGYLITKSNIIKL